MNSHRSIFSIHLLAWVLLLVMPVLFVSFQGGGHSPAIILGSWQFWVFAFIYLGIFYLNLLLLLPLLLRGRSFLYYAIVTLLLAAVFLFQPFDKLVARVSRGGAGMPGPPPDFAGNRPAPPPGAPGGRGPHVDIVGIFLGIVAIAIGLARALMLQWKATAARLIKAETGRLNAELAFLKARVNPHFLFNTLNNIYSLVQQRHEAAGESILRLSAIMRYVTDEAAANSTPLAAELDCIEDFISLQQLRLNSKTTVSFNRTGNEGGRMIAPLILMPFVENAFKYGVSSHEPSTILIETGCGTGEIWFTCRNRSMMPRQQQSRPGTGIENVRQRLQYLYPGRHHLEIIDKNGYFEVQLRLPDT